jgi:hypothetical protein
MKPPILYNERCVYISIYGSGNSSENEAGDFNFGNIFRMIMRCVLPNVIKIGAMERDVAKIKTKGNEVIIECGVRTEAKERVENGSHNIA